MLPQIESKEKKLNDYKGIVDDSLLREIKKLAKELKNKKVYMLNSTPRGGGVAEVLKSLTPLLRDTGLDCRWYTIPGTENFFKITKKMHSGLQGKDVFLKNGEKRKYLKHTKRVAKLVKDMKPDIWVVHDPQPAGLISYIPNFHPAISRIHIDLNAPGKGFWEFLSPYISQYDRIVFTTQEFVREEVKSKARVFAPAIDPTRPKNQPIDKELARRALESFGISADKPFISQVARFDRFKDPVGVVKSYKKAKKKIPNLQLALVGFFLAKDDPEAEEVYEEVKNEVGNDKDVFMFADLNQLGDMNISHFVRWVQCGSDIVLQKSIKEGFGLTVTEAMWKKQLVIAGNVGGIKLQIENGKDGFLVENVKECSERIVEIIENPKLAKKLGRNGQKKVRENFLMPRLARDYLKLFKEFL